MKTIVGIFAHPDDEAFGPGGTLATLAKENNVYLICATNGDAAEGKPNPKLGEKRKEELQKAANILGIKKVFFLSFKDGTLCNNLYFQLADAIKKILFDLKPELLITMEPRGISGHIDHVTVSMVTSFVGRKSSFVKEIWYYCISEKRRKLVPPYFIYFPPGYKKEAIDKIVATKEVWNLRKKAILQHKSQLKDMMGILAMDALSPKEEYFLVWKRNR